MFEKENTLRTGIEKSNLQKFNELLFEFSKLEEKTAYEDEEQYNIWYKGNGVGISAPFSASAGNPPSARYGVNEKNLRKDLYEIIDAAPNLSFQEKRDLKSNTQMIINEITDYAREIGRKRFYFENPMYWESKGFGHWYHRNTKRSAKTGHTPLDISTWDFDQ